MKGKTALLVMLFGLGLAALAIKLSVKWGGTPLPVISELPDFTLIDQNNDTLTLTKLKGSATVVDFIFTRCMGPCPMMALEMLKVQNRFADDPRLKHLSISVDPKNDTPDVLKQYGEALGAIPGKWNFATGEEEAIVKLSEEGFKLPASTWPTEHSTRFVLVDKIGRIRGYYDSLSDSAMVILEEDIVRLVKSKES